MTEEETMDAGALPLTADEERLLRFARSINGAPVDYPPVVAVDRLLATLDAIRAAAREPVAPAEAEPDILAMTTWPGYERHQHADGSWCQRKVDAALAQPPAPVSAEAAWELWDTDTGNFVSEHASLNELVRSVFRFGQANPSHDFANDLVVNPPEAAIRGTTAGTPLDAELLVKALAAVDERIAVEFPEEATEMRSDEAALGRRSYAEAVAVEYAVALRGQPSETPAAGETDRA